MSKRRRGIIIGCGKIAGGYNRSTDDEMVLTHALAYLRHPGYALTACVEPDDVARANFMTKWNVRHGYRTLDDALAAESFDVASVCSPTGTHLPALARLLEAGMKGVFAEKPLDGNAKQARELGQKFEQAGVPVIVNYTRRYDGAMITLKTQIGTGEFGVLRSVVGWYDRGLMNNGSHMIDLVGYLTGRGATPLRVEDAYDDGVPSDRSISALLDLGGASFRMISGKAQDYERFEIEFTFSKAVISIEDSGMTVRLRRAVPSAAFPGEIALEAGVTFPTQYGRAMVAALDELAGWRSGMRLTSDINSACEAVEVVEGIRRLAQESGT
jgi:predicted dehydrogenase